jgi:predicted enzyme involved in methoxymalonyl-ACP biosynthesis
MDDLATVRARWDSVSRDDVRPVVSVGLLASYTIDPVLPYLGVALHDAGLPVSFTTGPFNQIVQQCLDDNSVMASTRPDVLVVAPRFEELGDELLTAVDAAVAAARRWGSFLVLVLPAVPEERVYGHLDDGRAGGTAARAYEVREAVRALAADRPDAWVVDAEQAVRFVGTGKAHHAAMFKFAKIPYTEAVFAELAAQLAGVLRAVYGATPRVVVVDQESVAAFDEPVRRLRESGAQVVVGACQVSESAVLLELGPKPDAWPGELHRSGLLDRLPPPEAAPQRAQRVHRAGQTTVSLADFVAGLNVEVDLRPVGPDSSAKAVEVVSRAKDFTLGTETLDLTEPGREVLVIRVRDKFGQYGISGVVSLTREGTKRCVDVFSLSCVVLGKGVQDVVLRKLLDEPGEVVFRHRRTPHNQITAGFLVDAGATIEEIP